MVRRLPGHAAPIEGVVVGCAFSSRGGSRAECCAQWQDRPICDGCAELRSNGETLEPNGIGCEMRGLECAAKGRHCVNSSYELFDRLSTVDRPCYDHGATFRESTVCRNGSWANSIRVTPGQNRSHCLNGELPGMERKQLYEAHSVANLYIDHASALQSCHEYETQFLRQRATLQ